MRLGKLFLFTDSGLPEVKQLVELGVDSRQTPEPERSNSKLYFIVYVNSYNKISLETPFLFSLINLYSCFTMVC